MIEDHARARGRRIDRFEGRSVAKPLFQQKGGSSTVEATAPIACQAMALSCAQVLLCSFTQARGSFNAAASRRP